MQITLNQEEIDQAVQDFVRNQITIAEDQDVSIEFTAGRGPNGLSAAINISTATTDAAPVKAAPTRSKPKAVKATPAPTSTPEEEPVQEEETEVEAPAEEPEVDASESEPETETEAESEPETKPARAGKSIFSKAS